MYAISRSSICSLALLAAAFAVSQPVWADAPAADAVSGDQDNASLFQQLDANSDGFVTVDEVSEEKQRLLKRLLRSADADKDGKLSRDEFVAGLKGSQSKKLIGQTAEASQAASGPPAGFDAGALFSRLDADGDGKVTAAEVPEERRDGFSRLLERADADSDGALSRAEFDKVKDLVAGRFSGRPKTAEQAGAVENTLAAAGNKQGAAGSAQGAEVVFGALDKDGDGKLSPDEIRSASDSLAALDKDGDGSITLAELQRAGPRVPLAAAGGPNAGKLWQRLLAGDKNKDGKLSEEELPDRLRRAFSRLDANGDGTLDQQELATGMERFRGGAGKAE